MRTRFSLLLSLSLSLSLSLLGFAPTHAGNGWSDVAILWRGRLKSLALSTPAASSAPRRFH